MDDAPLAAVRAAVKAIVPMVDFSGREISYVKGPTACSNGSAARTGR
jgi:hypothetical protein